MRTTRLQLVLMAVSFPMAGLSIFAVGAVFRSSSKLDAPTLDPNGQSMQGFAGVTRQIRGGCGYPVKLSFEQILKSPATRLVFEGIVEQVLAPRHVRGSRFEHVYSPVEVRITAMHRGERPRHGRLTLRAFGGIVDGIEFVSCLEASEALRTAGTKVVVVAGEPAQVEGDTLRAITANAVYAVEGGELREITYANSSRDPDAWISKERAELLLLGAAIQ